MNGNSYAGRGSEEWKKEQREAGRTENGNGLGHGKSDNASRSRMGMKVATGGVNNMMTVELTS